MKLTCLTLKTYQLISILKISSPYRLIHKLTKKKKGKERNRG